MLDELLAGPDGEAEILGAGGLLGDPTRRLVERALSVDLTGHLGCGCGHRAGASGAADTPSRSRREGTSPRPPVRPDVNLRRV
jgi:hypothetical protein